MLETIPRSAPLFSDCYLQRMAQLQRVEPSVRGRGADMPWACRLTWSGVAHPTYDNQPAARFGQRNQRQHNGYNSPRRQRAKSESALAVSLRARGTKKSPGGFAPPGVVSSNSSPEHQGTMSRWTRMRKA